MSDQRIARADADDASKRREAEAVRLPRRPWQVHWPHIHRRRRVHRRRRLAAQEFAQNRDAVAPLRPCARRKPFKQSFRLARIERARRSAGFRRRGGAPAEAGQVMRAASLRTGPGQPFAAEGLRSDDGADLVAVDVQVSGLGGVHDLLHAPVDAGMQAERQAIAARVHLAHDVADFLGFEGRDVEDGAEHLPRHVADPVHADRDGRYEKAGFRRRDFMQYPAFGARLVDIGGDAVARLFVDHRADIGLQRQRIAKGQRVHRAEEHGLHLLRHFFLHIENAKRGAALARALEGRGDDVAYGLFRQGGAVDDHGVEAARFGDQHRFGVCFRQFRLDQLGDLGGAGEADAADPRRAGQGGADGPVALDEPKDIGGDARVMQQRHRPRCDQRRLFGGLGDDGVSGGQRRRDLTGENGEREVPGRDTDDCATRLAGQVAAARGVIAEEIHRFAQFRDGVIYGLPCFARQKGEELSEMGFVQIGGAVKRGGAVGGGRRSPAGRGADRRRHRFAGVSW